MKALLLAVLAAYGAVCALLWLAQERLIFLPPPANPSPAAPPGWRLEKVVVRAADGTRLAGVLALPPRERPPVVIYFGGNAEEVTANAASADRLYGSRAVLLVNYRGYGESGGSPGERALAADAIALHDWVLARTDLDGDRLCFHGRSLGSGVAVPLAAARSPRCVVLTAPFESLAAVARGHYPWLPTGWLLRHRFDSIAHAPALRVPLLVAIAASDTVVPPERAEALARAWGGPVEVVRLEGRDHNDLDLDPAHARGIAAFLDRHL